MQSLTAIALSLHSRIASPASRPCPFRAIILASVSLSRMLSPADVNCFITSPERSRAASTPATPCPRGLVETIPCTVTRSSSFTPKRKTTLGFSFAISSRTFSVATLMIMFGAIKLRGNPVAPQSSSCRVIFSLRSRFSRWKRTHRMYSDHLLQPAALLTHCVKMLSLVNLSKPKALHTLMKF